ncbi:MAG: MogA/MoaB family molybdenum cofactor biosynthesis protein [Proteobacteria bacterium]|nr:MogA/MoaB family molybdenum cofactor biosynthesis protein [Pseudomonadota bacterium]
MALNRVLNVGILTLSDSRTESEDQSGKALKELLEERGYAVSRYAVIPDDTNKITDTLISWADEKLDLILTTGGTGPGPRDVTPEATAAVIDKTLPGFSELIRFEGGKKTDRAYLTRGLSGIRGQTVIINLPGSVKGATESLEAVVNLIPHTITMMEGEGH